MPLGSRPVSYLGLSLFESGEIYQPDSLAKRIVNMSRTPEGTLKSFQGTRAYAPRDGIFAAPIYGLAHSESLDGANQVTAIRVSTTLKRHQGWTRSWTTYSSGLTTDVNQPFPDAMVPINGKIVWCNGYDRPQVIDCSRQYGRLMSPLGFDTAPAAPTVLSPGKGTYDASNYTGTAGAGTSYGAGAGTEVPNSQGYTVPGNIGTVSQYNGEDGALLDSQHFYCYQWESDNGDLSPLSRPSNAAIIQQQSTGYVGTGQIGTTVALPGYIRKNKLDMLLRGFCVRGIEPGETHVKAVWLYRTTDTLHSSGEYHLVERFEGREEFTYPDAQSDGTILNKQGPVPCVPVVPFKVACEYQGRLVAGNFASEPGKVVWSEPGFAGTWRDTSWAVPDAGGSQVTGLKPYDGGVLVFTENSVFKMNIDAEGVRLQPISASVGCVAPHSIQTLPDGSLIWLGRTSVFRLQGNQVVDTGTQIRDVLAKINRSRAGRACSGVDPTTGLYVLAFSLATTSNDKVMGFDYLVEGWREYDLGAIYPNVFHAASGRAGHLLFGTSGGDGFHEVRLWDHPPHDGTPAVTSTYESVELRIDEQGLVPFRVRELLVGFIESDCDPSTAGCNVRVYKGSRKTGTTPTESYFDTTMELVSQDFADAWRLGGVTLAGVAAYFRDPAVTWRRVPVDIGVVTGFRFRLESASGRRLHLHGIAIIAEPLGKEASRLPGRTRTGS